MIQKILSIALGTVGFFSSVGHAIDYPPPPGGVRTGSDLVHGITVQDPYRALEEKSDEVTQWAVAQDKLARETIRTGKRWKMIRRLIGIELSRAFRRPPEKRGSWLFSLERTSSPTGDKPFVVMREHAKSKKRVLFFDPTKLDPSGDTQISAIQDSPHGNYLAIGLRVKNSDWTRWQVYNSETMTPVGAPAHGIKWEIARWTAGEEGLLISRYPRELWDTDAKGKNQSVWFRKLGSDGSSDVELFAPEDPAFVTFPYASEDGRYLIYQVRQNSDDTAKIFVVKIDSNTFSNTPQTKSIRARPVRPIVGSFKSADYVTLVDEELFITTKENAPRGRLVAIKLDDTLTTRELVPQQKGILLSATVLGKSILTVHRIDGEDQLRAWTMNGKASKLTGLPEGGVISGLNTHLASDAEGFLWQMDGLHPPSVYRLISTPQGLEASLFWKSSASLPLGKYVMRKESIKVDDGVSVEVALKEPLSARDTLPILIQGYGCYGSVRGSQYDILDAVWLQLGGKSAFVQVRGGGEKGEDWHQAAMGTKKHRSILDFVGAAKGLPGPKVIMGGSCGGLLVAASVLRAPELFRGALIQYGILDLLRFTEFSGGALWANELGDPKDPEQFKSLAALSPVHTVPHDTLLPPIMIYHGGNDIRVPPLHSFKLLASLQGTAKGGPFWFLFEPKGGHGPVPNDRRGDLMADELSFLWDSARATVKAPTEPPKAQ